MRLDPEQGAYAGIPCWNGRAAWLANATTVFRAHYLTVRRGGDELSLKAFLAVCAVMSAPGRVDPTTGRDARQAVATIAASAGVSESVVQRTRRYLTVLGLGTEVLRGRQRTRGERMASWRVGDKARGWASVWALHPRRPQPGDPPVDDHPQVRVLIQQTGTPSGNGPVGTSPSVKNLVSSRHRSRAAGNEDGAARRATTRKGRKPGRAVPDGPGLALTKRWRAQPDCPGWVRRFSAETWSRSLAAYAAHGWTERDLTQALRDVAAMGIRIYDDPRRPIPYLLMLLRRSSIDERPTIRLNAYAAEKLAGPANVPPKPRSAAPNTTRTGRRRSPLLAARPVPRYSPSPAQQPNAPNATESARRNAVHVGERPTSEVGLDRPHSCELVDVAHALTATLGFYQNRYYTIVLARNTLLPLLARRSGALVEMPTRVQSKLSRLHRACLYRYVRY